MKTNTVMTYMCKGTAERNAEVYGIMSMRDSLFIIQPQIYSQFSGMDMKLTQLFFHNIITLLRQ